MPAVVTGTCICHFTLSQILNESTKIQPKLYYSGKYYAYIQVWKNNVCELSFQSNAGADYSNENTLSATWLMKLQKSDRIQLKANKF